VNPVRFTSSTAEERYDALVAVASSSVVGLDFDGTLAPIVDDPETAHIHPEAPEVLRDLAEVVRAVAVITGRPARKALALGGLDEVGQQIGEAGRELFVFGQYGFERWSSTQRRVVSPKPPGGLSGFLRDLPRVLREADAADAFVEEKGLAIAVHTRRLDDPVAAYERLKPALRDLAERYGLAEEPGRNVIEVRSPGMDKGVVVRDLAEEVGAGGFLFAGDDLGDVEAFEAVAELREQGMPTLLVCSASQEESTLVELSDVVVPGPEGVLDLLRRLTADARAAAAR
jgi:trehalose 6-phosphate phosphatase